MTNTYHRDESYAELEPEVEEVVDLELVISLRLVQDLVLFLNTI